MEIEASATGVRDQATCPVRAHEDILGTVAIGIPGGREAQSQSIAPLIEMDARVPPVVAPPKLEVRQVVEPYPPHFITWKPVDIRGCDEKLREAVPVVVAQGKHADAPKAEIVANLESLD
jgi:hypothetical protein